MFDEFYKEYGQGVDIRQPTRRQGGRYQCIRCGVVKGNAAIAAAMKDSPTGLCHRCCTQEEKIICLSLPLWGPPTRRRSHAAEVEVPSQPDCPVCHKPAITGLVLSIRDEALKECQSCYDAERDVVMKRLSGT